MRSLVWKFTLAFWVVSLVGVVLVAVLAVVLVQERSADLEDRINRDVVANALIRYYNNNGDLPSRRNVSDALSIRDNINWLVIDEKERIILSSSRDPRRPNDSSVQSATPLIAGDEEIGRLILLTQRGSNGQMEREISAARAEFLDSFWQSLAFGAVGATALSLLAGILFSRQLTRPIQDLTQATRAVAKGDLDQQVRVQSHDELGELAQAFNQMGHDLADAQRARRQMTADIAHDLRTPLAVIQGHTEGLLDGVLPPTDATFSIIHDESLRLNRLIEDLRTLSLADAGNLPLLKRLSDPQALLERTVVVHKPLADERGVALELNIDGTLPDVDIDSDRMAQVLDNLVSNALRYTHADGTVTLSSHVATSQLSQQTTLFITVEDTGQGISAEDLPHIFDRFYRADKARQRRSGKSIGGSGLGLAIAQSVVQQHGGQIQAFSRLGEGTTFTISLPVGHTLHTNASQSVHNSGLS